MQQIATQYLIPLCLGAAIAFFLPSFQPDRVEDFYAPADVGDPPVVSTHRIAARSTLLDSMVEAGFNTQEVYTLVQASKPLYDLGRIQANLVYNVHWVNEQPDTVLFELSPERHLFLRRVGELAWFADWHRWPIDTYRRSYSGTVSSSLWESARQAGMDTSLINELSLVFAWQIDFERQVRSGDRWRLVVNEKQINGKVIGYEDIVVAEYILQKETFTAIRFIDKDNRNPGYYMPDGSSLKRLFLKSPMKFGRISSRFRLSRFHPILKRNIPHNGVDYAAPPGTPVYSVGKGVVVKSGRFGNSGIMVKIRHNSTYETAYLHLQKIRPGIKNGKKVEQGDVIGYVGSTGLATGPHLHFSFYERGRYVDPLGKKFPSEPPVKDMDRFKEVADDALRLLPPWPSDAGIEPGPEVSSLSIIE
jgi:murein DD-endopeptidase MepM/ murein hydrolase activator NlpD